KNFLYMILSPDSDTWGFSFINNALATLPGMDPYNTVPLTNTSKTPLRILNDNYLLMDHFGPVGHLLKVHEIAQDGSLTELPDSVLLIASTPACTSESGALTLSL